MSKAIKASKTLHDFWTVDNSAYWRASDINKPFTDLLTTGSFTDMFAKGPFALADMGKAAIGSYWDVLTSNSVAVLNSWRGVGAGGSN